MFRRRRSAEEEAAPAVEAEETAAPARATGPWDAQEGYPEAERVDLGGLLLPIGPGFEVQLRMAGDVIDAAIVLVEESVLQVQAHAAPKRSGIWDEVRADLARQITAAGGTATEQEGPFGPELAAQEPVPGQSPRPVRHLGVDGPRWLLRATISGRAALDSTAAAVLEEVVRDVVVVRGDDPMPPRETIPLRLPAEARQAEQQEEEERRPDFKPFERGPEIQEIR